jgi:hypothetical protein
MYHMFKCLVIDVDTIIKSVGCFQFNYDKIFICFSLTYVIHSASMTTDSRVVYSTNSFCYHTSFYYRSKLAEDNCHRKLASK